MSRSEAYEKLEQEILARGRQEGRNELAQKMLQNPKYSLEEIAELTELPIKQLKTLQNQMRG